jgi:hypothetical protein
VGTNYSATLSVADNAPGQPQTTVLTGTGIANQDLAINEVIHTTDTPAATGGTAGRSNSWPEDDMHRSEIMPPRAMGPWPVRAGDILRLPEPCLRALRDAHGA